MEFIRGTTLVHLKIRCWSGAKKADREHDVIVGVGGKMPPQKLLEIGRKKIFPPSALSPLTNRRKAAERACLDVGTRFMGGFAIPDAEVDDVVGKLEQLQQEFEVAKADFLSNYDARLSTWVNDNQEYEHLFFDQLPDRDQIKQKFWFKYGLYKLQPCEGFEPDEDEVANQILHECSVACSDMVDAMLKRKTAISGNKLKEQLAPLVKRLDALSFGNGSVLKVCEEFRALHDSIPLERIHSEHERFSQTITFLSMCSDSNKLERIIEGQFSVAELISPKLADIDTSSNESMPVIPQQATIDVTSVSTGGYF